MNATSSSALEITSPWEQTRAFEWIIIVLGGLPLFLPFVLWAGEGELAKQNPISWYYWMGAIFSAPHVYSTYLRLSRKIGEKRVHWAFGVPAYAALVALLAVSSRFGWFVTVMTAVNVWQTLHYVRQGYGVNRFFARGSGEDALDRRLAYWAFHLSMPLFVFGRWDMLYTAWRGIPSNVIIPVRFPPVFMTGCWVLFFVAIALGLLLEARKMSRGLRKYDPIGLVTLGVFFAIHAYGFLSLSHYQRGFFAVTIFHGVQYLGLLWLLENQAVPKYPTTARTSRVLRQFPFFLCWFVFFGVSFFLERVFAVRVNVFWPAFSMVVMSAVSAHHYLVDSVLWRATAGK